MEPDISAISSSPIADSHGRSSPDEALRPDPSRPDPGASVVTLSSPTRVSRPVSSNGNGHGPLPANGHVHLAVDALPAPAIPWRALGGPVRGASGAGSYAVAPAHSTPVAEAGSYLRFGKRLLDVVGASVALILSAPLMLLAALAIMLETHGAVLYRSTRVGRGGKPFTFYKLRSMVNGADRHRHHLSHLNECDGPVFKISRDPRVTVVGRFLRTTSLDELPQFWNVLRGDMSLVGPRPPLPGEVSHYQPWQMRRLEVRPGLTCLWQISGRSRIGFEEWMRLDLEYINRRSLRLDLKILLRTIPAVLSREGAY